MSTLRDAMFHRLNDLLPLAERQATLAPDLRRVHQQILRSLVERGRPLSIPEIAEMVPAHDAFAAIWTLKSLDLIVLDALGHPAGAYPVTVEQTPHEVSVNGNKIFAMCALDAVAVAPMFDTRTEIRSRCAVTCDEIAITMKGSEIVTMTPGPDVQIGVWWRDPGSIAARNFCPGIMFLRDRVAAEKWRGSRTADHDFAPVSEAVEVARRFFLPLIGVLAETEALAV